MTIFPDYYLRGRRKKRDRENLFLARIFQKFRPTASILLSCILLASIIFASLATYSRNDAYLSMRLGGASPAFSYKSHAGKSTKRYRGVVKMRTPPAHEKSEGKQSPECSHDEESRQVYGVNCRHRPLL